MICKFCKQCCKPEISSTPSVGISCCNNHEYKITYYWFVSRPDEMLEYLFICDKWRVCYLEDGEGDSFRIDPIPLADNFKPLVQFDFIPNVTPENILDKLPLLITFS